jgi:hypothetical protein
MAADNSRATVTKQSATQADPERLRRQVEMMAAVGNDSRDIAGGWFPEIVASKCCPKPLPLAGQ